MNGTWFNRERSRSRPSFVMALPGNTDKAQSPAKCQFCDESNIRWKCINCDLFLCQLCSYRIHSKSKSSLDHEIINFQNSFTLDAEESHRKVDLDNMKCECHQGQRCVSYCCDCDRIICVQCFEDAHKTHSKENLMTNYKTKMIKIENFKRHIVESFSFYEVEKKRLQTLLDFQTKNYDEIKAIILKTHREIKNAIKRYTNDLIKHLGDAFNKTREEIMEQTTALQNSITELISKQNDINNLLMTHSAADILIKTKESLLSLKQLNIHTPRTMKFVPGKTLKLPMSESFGHLIICPNIELKNTYQTALENVQRILQINDKIMLIASGASNKIQTVEFKEKTFSVLKEIDTDIYGMAILANNNVIVSTGECGLNYYNNDGPLRLMKSFSPLHTIAVHVNKREEILVGLAEPGTSIALKDDSVRKIVVLDTSGNIKYEYELDRTNERLFTWPGNLETYDHKILVVDSINDSLSGRIVVINYDKQVQWNYSGVSDELSFYPMDAVITENRKILVTDVYNDAIHVLNYKGQLIECCVLRDQGVISPLSLDIDNEGMIWVGSSAAIYVLALK